MKLCSVIIWYNPDEKCISNIKTYLHAVEHVYIVDNSSCDNSFLLKDMPQIEYIPLFDNLGIAAAQNIGCRKAIEDGFEWCMTMDQDSYWQEDQLKKYLDFVDGNMPLNKYYSFGASYTEAKMGSVVQDFKNIIKKLIHYQKSQEIHPEVEEIEILISSGNIINLKKWQEVSGFNEDFFIDDVDHEFCLKLNEKYPGCLVKYNGAVLNHELGTPKKTFFVRLDFHTGIRLYYCVRNALYMRDKYPDFSKKWQRIESYKKVFWQNIRDFHFKTVTYMIRGYMDYKKGIVGKYQSKKQHKK